MSNALHVVSGQHRFYYLLEIKETLFVEQQFPGVYQWYEAQCYMRHDLSSKQPVFYVRTAPLIEHEFKRKSFLVQLYGEGSRGFHSLDFLSDLWHHVEKLPQLPIPLVNLDHLVLTPKD